MTKTANVTNTEVKNTILELFQKARQRPDTNFELSHFLDFLTHPPHKKNSIKNTFKGVKRYYRFMDMLELEFGICFKLSDLDRYYSVDALTKKVLERMQKANGNKMVLKQRKERKQNHVIDVVLLLVLAVFYAYWGIHWLPLAATALFVSVFYWLYSSRSYEKRHIKKLESRLLGKQT